MANTKNDYVTLSVSDGSSMHAYTAVPEGEGPFPAILVFQEAFGVNGHIRDLTERFAAQGYIAIAPEMYHRTAPAYFEVDYTDFASVAPHAQALTNAGIEADIRAAYNWLKDHKSLRGNDIVSTGYCMGGRMSFIANSILPIRAAASYYAGGMPGVIDRTKDQHGPILFFWGGQDKHIKPEHIDMVVKGMTEAGKPFINVVISDADHGFFCDVRDSYNPDAAKEAWALTLSFFQTKLRA